MPYWGSWEVGIVHQRMFHVRVHVDVFLDGGNGAVLQEFLYQKDIIMVVSVDFAYKEFPEGVRIDGIAIADSSLLELWYMNIMY